MTKEDLKIAVDRLLTWPQHRQKVAVELLMTIDSWGDDPYPLSKEDLADLRVSLKETETIPYEDVKALFNQYR